MMKRILILLFLTQLLHHASAQVNKWHTVQLDSALGGKIISRLHDYYFESIVDKRANRSDIGTNIYQDKLYPLNFESDSAALDLHQFLNKILPKAEGKKAIHAEINFLQLGNYLLSGIPNDGYAYLDIDFYDKNSLGEKRLICHYHGSMINEESKNVLKTHPERMYFLFRWALKKLDKATNQAIELEEMAFMKPTYVPQKGLYRSLMEYRRNTPLSTNQIDKVLKQRYDEEFDTIEQKEEKERKRTIKLKSDSLEGKFLGYSNGSDFFIVTQRNDIKIIANKCITKGRYLYINDIPRPSNNGTYLPYMGGGLIGGLIVGVANAAINSTSQVVFTGKYLIIDTFTGDLLTFDSSNFQAAIPKDNNDALEYKFYKKEENLIKLIHTMNEYYGNSK